MGQKQGDCLLFVIVHILVRFNRQCRLLSTKITKRKQSPAKQLMFFCFFYFIKFLNSSNDTSFLLSVTVFLTTSVIFLSTAMPTRVSLFSFFPM